MKFIPEGLSQHIGRQVLTLQKNSPRLLFVVGIGSVVASTVLACRATVKLGPVLDEFHDDIQSVKTELVHHNSTSKKMLPVREYKKDLAYVYIRGTMDIVKLYAPSVIIGAVGIGCLTQSHSELTKRNANLSAAYAALQASFDQYRQRVRDKYGAEAEEDIYRSAREETVMVDGKQKKIKVYDPSMYARVFDETNRNWKRNAEYNKLWLQSQQNYANHLLHSRGHIFLNEIYDQLGFEHTQAGAVVGWIVGRGIQSGDGFIDFGLDRPENDRFAKGWEQSVWIDFNVDGEIYKLLG